MKPLLLTGANGFIGSHLQKPLAAAGYQVIKADLPDFNLESPETVAKMVNSQDWDTVIHLSGMSHVADCDKNPARAKAINTEGTSLILDKLLQNKSRCHFIFASTAQVYARPEGAEVEKGITFTESRKVVPQNVYAETKRQAEILVESAAGKGDLTATVVRLFNHTHKTQPPSFFLPHIYQQLGVSKGQPVPVGNLDVDRDIGSVRDLTEAFLAILSKRNWKFETFNICSGKAKNLRRLAHGLSERMHVRAEFVVEPSRVRVGEPKLLLGSHEKLTRAVGWTPQVVSEDQLLDDFLCE